LNHPSFLFKAPLCMAMSLSLLVALPTGQAAPSKVKPIQYSDGWSLYDEDVKTDLKDASASGLWTISLEERPLLQPNELPPTVHPLMKALNRYEVMTFTPNPEWIDWQQDIEINGNRRTVNIVQQVRGEVDEALGTPASETSSSEEAPLVPTAVDEKAPAPPPAVEAVPEDIKQTASSSVKNVFKKTGKVLGGAVLAVLAIPVAVVVLLLCSPFLIMAGVDKTKRNIEAGKTKRGNQQVKKELEQADYMMARIQRLQQQFDVKNAANQQRNTYHLLPDLNHYSVHLLGKDMLYRPSYTIYLNMTFKKLMPASKLEAAVNKSSTQLFVNTITPDALPHTAELELAKLPRGNYIHSCQLNLAFGKQAPSHTLNCNGVTTP
jgi:hypothetical protein